MKFFTRGVSHINKRFLRIGIRQQLIFLVIFVAMFSVIILAVVTGLYFSTNYRNMRSDRLKVIAQLKASQLEQNLNFLYYQAYWLAAKDTIQNSLVSYRAGNTSDSNWAAAEDNIEQFLQSTITFASVRVYDTKFSPVIQSSSNWSNIYLPEDVQEALFPIDSDNYTIPNAVDTTGFITGPIRNDSNTFAMSMTIPVFSQASILFDSSDLVGYITTTMTAQSLAIVLTDNSTALQDSTVVILIADTSENSTVTSNSTYRYAFPEASDSADYPVTYTVGNNEIARQVLRDEETGSDADTKTEQGTSVAAGYCPVDFDMVNWAAVIEQKRVTFMRPSDQFTKIIVGVCFAIALFMAIITFPLAHWAVQPIRELQKATERIATGRGLQAHSGRYRKDKDKDGKFNEKSSARASMNSTANENFIYPPATPTHSSSSPVDAPNSEAASVSSAVGSAGHPSYLQSARVPTYKRIFYDELSQLTETFNVMTDELDRQYTHLEDRVKARTKQLEASKIQAEAANEAKTVFIANISHELRTPLNGILGMTAIAMAESDPIKIQQSLKLIFRSGELLLHILTELLTFSKNSLKRSKLENADFSVMEVALQIKSIFGKLAKDQNVNLSILVTPNIIRRMVLYGDSNRIIQIVMNLVSNSLKFTPVDGKVGVTVRNLGLYDEEKSKASNYQKVFVIPDSSPSNDTPHKEIKQYGSSTSEETEQSRNTSLGEDMDDAKSIATVSTSSYDDALFKSQFKVSGEGEADEKARTRPVTHEKTWVFEFVVEDTGPGIESKLQDAVFEPFVQGDQTLSRQYGGTGLGLSICRQLASMMKGVMELESTVGVGSKFTFKVPLTQTRELVVDDSDVQMYEDEFNVHSKKNRRVKILDPEDHTTPGNDEESAAFSTSLERPGGYFNKAYLNSTGNAKASSSSLHSAVSSKGYSPGASRDLRILVAEDNNVNQEVIKRMLNLEGFNDIALAVDGEEAINLVKEKLLEGETYDLVFMDVQMPKVDGLMATRTIIQDLGYKGPIVALTAFADESNVKECLDAGMNGFLSKPIRRSQLRQILHEFATVQFTDEVLTPTRE